MSHMIERQILRKRRHVRIRKRVLGTNEKPRLCIYRSNKYIYVQATDDLANVVLAAASSLEKDGRAQFKGHASKAAAKWVGERVSERLQKKGVANVVFDRNGYLYFGVVKELADAARAKGLKF